MGKDNDQGLAPYGIKRTFFDRMKGALRRFRNRFIPHLVWYNDEVDVRISFKGLVNGVPTHVSTTELHIIENILNKMGIGFDLGFHHMEFRRDWEWDYSLKGPVAVQFRRRVERPENRHTGGYHAEQDEEAGPDDDGGVQEPGVPEEGGDSAAGGVRVPRSGQAEEKGEVDYNLHPLQRAAIGGFNENDFYPAFSGVSDPTFLKLLTPAGVYGAALQMGKTESLHLTMEKRMKEAVVAVRHNRAKEDPSPLQICAVMYDREVFRTLHHP